MSLGRKKLTLEADEDLDDFSSTATPGAFGPLPSLRIKGGKGLCSNNNNNVESNLGHNFILHARFTALRTMPIIAVISHCYHM